MDTPPTAQGKRVQDLQSSQSSSTPLRRRGTVGAMVPSDLPLNRSNKGVRRATFVGKPGLDEVEARLSINSLYRAGQLDLLKLSGEWVACEFLLDGDTLCIHPVESSDGKASSGGGSQGEKVASLSESTTLSSSQQQMRSWTEVHLYSSTSVAPSSRHSETTFQVRLSDSEFLHARAKTVDEMNGWVFDIHKAVLLATIQEERNERHARKTEGLAIFKPEKSATHSRNMTDSVESSKLVFQMAAVAAAEGRRDGMEDRHVVFTNLRKDLSLSRECSDMALFAVYDGHGGTKAADYLAEHLHYDIVSHEAFPSDLHKSLTDAFSTIDRKFLDHAMENDLRDGSTAIVSLIHRDTLYVANCGDCRAVVSCQGTAIAMSDDHRPGREDEKDRIESAGGWIMSREVLNVPMLYRLGLEDDDEIDDDELEARCGLTMVYRVNGVLSMTRSLGDILIKDKREETFGCEFTGDIISPIPEIKSRGLTKDDEFLILACDGLWDVESNQDAVDFVRKQLQGGASPQEAADRLIVQAIEHGSLDNVTIVIIILSGLSNDS